jgi:hypothetical protein
MIVDIHLTKSGEHLHLRVVAQPPYDGLANKNNPYRQLLDSKKRYI